jgi:MFS family permease
MEAAALVPDPRRWHALALVCVAFFMVVLDIAIVNVALPSISVDLDLSQDTLQWIVTAYSLAFGGFLLLGGRAADLLGRRRVFMVGMVLFTGGSLACALSDSGAALIVFRALRDSAGRSSLRRRSRSSAQPFDTAARCETRPSGSGARLQAAEPRPASCSAASSSSTSAGSGSSS